MVLFENVRDLRFADNVENFLMNISNELKIANRLKEQELELLNQQFTLQKGKEKELGLLENYRNAFEVACERLAELDALLYEYDKSVAPFPKEKYQDIILSNICKHNKEKVVSATLEVIEISKEEFQEAIRVGGEYEEKCLKVQEKFGNSFMYFDPIDKKYVCYDFVQGENNLPNIEVIEDKILAEKWLRGEIEMDEIEKIQDKEDIEYNI